MNRLILLEAKAMSLFNLTHQTNLNNNAKEQEQIIP
jgi:hypothetical protein